MDIIILEGTSTIDYLVPGHIMKYHWYIILREPQNHSIAQARKRHLPTPTLTAPTNL